MNTNLFFRRLANTFPYGYRRTSWFWPMTLGMGVGVLAGVSFGVLYAPRSGKETRQRLRDGAERVQERARIAAHRVRGELEGSAAEIREHARGTISAPQYP
ncbi:MAG TPA: YtxH domain-containing protein [Polyangium sp.]|nr:YtxH domain-containing protein [Polyangium sp.]